MRDRTGSMYAHELIGTRVEVTDAPHKGYIGIEGKVVDETKNTISLENGDVKQIPKKGATFKVQIKNYDALIKGNRLAHRPHERIKRLS
ncbi:MAG: ribonuclease P protein component 1 [Thermoplasmatota archaeon]